jgi:hypothetical protein
MAEGSCRLATMSGRAIGEDLIVASSDTVCLEDFGIVPTAAQKRSARQGNREGTVGEQLFSNVWID